MHALRHHIESLAAGRRNPGARFVGLLVVAACLLAGGVVTSRVETVFTSLGIFAAALATLVAGWRIGAITVLLSVVLGWGINWAALMSTDPEVRLSLTPETVRLMLFVPVGIMGVLITELLRRVVSDLAERERASVERARARATLVSVANHELRAPLTSIMGFSGRLARVADDPEQVREAAAWIHRGGEQMLATIDRFLTLARVESGQYADVREPVALDELLRDEARWLRERHAAAQLSEQFPHEPLVVTTDPRAISHIVRNLLENAVNHGGGAPIFLMLVPSDQGARVVVCDRGPGIPVDVQPHIFERFGRGGHDCDGGLGLGLYISFELARQIGASLTYEDEPNAGARFVLSLPRSAVVDGLDTDDTRAHSTA